jgi:hypothetical protein
MKKFLLALLFLLPFSAQAGTLTVTTAGFATLPATAPSGWPSNLKWPGGGAVNGTKTYTITDTDYQLMLVWAANANNAQIVAGVCPSPCGTPPPYTVTGLQVLVSLVQNWVNGMIQAVSVQFTTPAQPPPPITIQ